MAAKNIEKRNEIMAYAYLLFSEKDYNDVFLKDIAEHININKSLLQYYFPKKKDIMNSLLMDFLCTTFSYLEQKEEKDDQKNVYIMLALCTITLWTAVDYNKRLNKFMSNAICQIEVFDSFIESIFKWLKEMRFNQNNMFEPHILKIALCFSVTGSMSLYMKKDELGVSTSYICEQSIRSFMRVMEVRKEEHDVVMNKVTKSFQNLELSDFYQYCDQKLNWFQL